MKPASEEEMTKRRRFADMLREQTDMPVTEEELKLWQELQDEFNRGRLAVRTLYNLPRRWPMTMQEILSDIHSLEEELLDFERKYGLRSETFYAAYANGEEPEDDRWVLDFGEWASVYRTWLARQAEYRNEVQRIQGNRPSLEGLIRVVA